MKSEKGNYVMNYHVFKRRPWKRNPAWPGGWEPHGGARKTTVQHGVSLEDARRICADGNKGKVRGKPGELFYEFEYE